MRSNKSDLNYYLIESDWKVEVLNVEKEVKKQKVERLKVKTQEKETKSKVKIASIIINESWISRSC